VQNSARISSNCAAADQPQVPRVFCFQFRSVRSLSLFLVRRYSRTRSGVAIRAGILTSLASLFDASKQPHREEGVREAVGHEVRSRQKSAGTEARLSGQE